MAWKWEIRITKVDNGYVIEYPNDMGVKDIAVIEEPEEMDGEKKAGVALLWWLIDHFGLRGSKYDEWRVTAMLEHGHCWEDPMKKEDEKDDAAKDVPA